MVKMVLVDIRQNTTRGLVESVKRGKLFWYFYILFICPMLYMSKNLAILLVYYSFAIPLIVEHILSEIQPLAINPTLKLCPISEEERILYVKTIYWIRMGITLMLITVMQGILLVTRQVVYETSFFIVITCIMLAIIVGMDSELFSTKGVFEHIGIRKGNYMFVQLFGYLSGLGGFSCLLVILNENDMAWEWYMYYVLVGVQILSTVIFMKKYYKKLILFAAYSERSVEEKNDNRKEN